MGGSSSQTIGQRYFAKLAVFIGNPIENLIGINFDNRGWIYKPDGDESSFRIEKQNLYGDKEGGVAGFVDIHTGTADQLPNAFYKADFPKVSGYPYQSYLVFRGLGQRVSGGIIGGIAGIIMGRQHYSASFYLGNSGYMKEMLLWPQRIYVRNDGRPQWYDEKAEINAGWVKGSAAYDFNGLTWEFGEETSTTNAYPNIEKVAIVEIYDEPDKIHTVNIEFKAFVEMRPVIGGEVAGGENGEIVKGGEYDVGASAEGISHKWFNRYTLEISDPPQIYYLNNGTAVNKGRSSFSGNFSVQVRNGATITAKAETGDPGYTGTINGYWQYIKFKAKGENGKYADINPIHKIREILTDDTAMNKPESDVNDMNFRKAADVLYAEKMGISWSVTEKSCLDAINELCGHIEAGVRINRQTGLYEMVLFRDDWFDENEIHILPQNKIKSLQLDVQNADESINQLNVSYYNRDAIKNSSFSIAENASIKNLQGRVNAETADFPYFMNQRNAAVVAQWKLKQMSTPVWQGTFTTGFYEARKWNRYDLLKLAWPRKWSGTILVRIMKINLGTGTDVSIDFVEVVPYSSDLSSNIVIDTPVDTSPKPPQLALFKAFELSYFEAVQMNGQKAVDDALAYNPDAGYAAVIAKRPQNNSLNALMYSDAGNGFERAGAIAYSETAELDQAISQTNTAFIVKNVGNLGAIRLGTQITIASEIMVYQSYDAETSLLTVKRGALDTIPQIHSAGSVLYFADDFITVDPTEYVTSEVIDVKALTTTPSGILDIEDVDAQQVEIQARAIRPYPPANVKINSEYWPAYFEDDFTLTWSNRNRLQQTGGDFIGYFESSVALEENTQTLLTVIELDATDVELVTHSVNVTASNSFTLLESAMQADTRSLDINLKTVRDGYECMNVFDRIVKRSTLIAPSNVTFEVIGY